MHDQSQLRKKILVLRKNVKHSPIPADPFRKRKSPRGGPTRHDRPATEMRGEKGEHLRGTVRRQDETLK